MRKIVTIVALSAACCTASAALAQGQLCNDLWFRRNAIYKSAGYCFNTPRGVQTFGNAGCQFDDAGSVPLSPYQHRLVAQIIDQERDLRCR